MTEAKAGAEPRRLASRDDGVGRLLREADRAFRVQRTPELDWNRFQSRRHGAWAPRLALLLVAAGLVAAFTRQRLAAVRARDEMTMPVAEHVPAPPPSALAPRHAAAQERRVSPLPSPTPSPHSTSAPVSARHNPVAPPPQLAVPLTDATCRAWASQARPERAIECYQMIAREAGIGAEVALYEAARLSAESLGDAPRTLTLLEQHGARFPNSVLRVEVEWLKIRSLERAGRLDEALTASEALLDSAAGRALAPKLHLLRGRIYADRRHECALALPEYVALLGEPGPAGDEAELSRARCLEQLQKNDEARAAYERYLGRADARSAEAARARLDALLKSAEAPEGPR